MPETPPTIAVLLAAGAGRRFHGETHKLRAPLGDTTVAGAALEHVIEADIGPTLVVTGAIDLGDVIERAAASGRSPITEINHPGWRAGQATSLHAAIDAANELGADSIVVGLADQPFIEPDAWRRVAASNSPIAVATYDGQRRNPVRLHRSVWPLVPTTGDEGARSLLRVRPDLVEEVPCAGSPADIDTQEDLPSWPNRSSTNSP